MTSWLRSAYGRAAGSANAQTAQTEGAAQADLRDIQSPEGDIGRTRDGKYMISPDEQVDAGKAVSNAIERNEDTGRSKYTRFVAASVMSLAGSLAEVGSRAAVGAMKNVQGRLSNKVEVSMAMERLERDAGELRGEARRAKLRAWCQALRGPEGSEVEEAEQDLLDAAPTAAHQRVGDTTNHARVLLKQQVFVDSSVHPATQHTFREVLLKSAALQTLCENLLRAQPEGEEEEELLLELLGATVVGGATTAQSILRCVRDLAPALQAHTLELKASNAELAAVVRNAVQAVKCNPDIEALERQAASVRAAAVAQQAQLPVPGELGGGPDAPGSLAEGGAGVGDRQLAEAAAESRDAIRLSRVLHAHLARQLAATKDSAPAEALSQLDAKLESVAACILDATEGLAKTKEDAETQQRNTEGFRAARMQKMGEEGESLARKIQDLRAERAELERQLAANAAALAEAEARLGASGEQREAFEEANAAVVEALGEEARRAQREEDAAHDEARLVGQCRAFLGEVRAAQAEASAAAVVAAGVAGRAAAVAATRGAAQHARIQTQRARTLLQRLHFCARETAAMADKTAQMAALGMEGMVAELTSGRAKITEKYSEAYQDAHAILLSLSELRKESAAFLDSLPEDARHQAELQESQTSLEECLVGAEAMRRQLDLLDPPSTPIPTSPAPAMLPLPLHHHQASFVEAPSNTAAARALPERATSSVTTADNPDSTDQGTDSPSPMQTPTLMPALHSFPATMVAAVAETTSAEQGVADHQPSQGEEVKLSVALAATVVPQLESALHVAKEQETNTNDDSLKDGDVNGLEVTTSMDVTKSAQPEIQLLVKSKKAKKKPMKNSSESESCHVAATLKAPPPPPPRTVPTPEEDDDFFKNLS